MTTDVSGAATPPAETELLAAADTALQQGDLPAALAAWQALRTHHPGNPSGWRRAGEALREARQFEPAESVLQDGVSRFPGDFWMARSHAMVARERGEPGEALARARGLRLRFPAYAAAWADYARWQLESGNPQVAEAEAEAGLALYPSYEWLLQVHAGCADALGAQAAAAERWATLLSRHPGHAPAHPLAVLALHAAGRTDLAQQVAIIGLLLSPNNRALADAVATFAPAGDLAGDAADIATLTAHARQAATQQHWPQAATQWLRLARLVPTMAEAYVAGAQALHRQGSVCAAEMLLHLGRQRLPEDRTVIAAWAESAAARDDTAEALRRFQVLQLAAPDDAAAAAGVAAMLLRLGRLAAAEAALAGPLTQPEPSHAVRAAWAAIATARADTVEASRRWSQVWAAYPDDRDAHLRLAEALSGAGNAAEADAVLTDARTRFPDDVAIATAWASAAEANPDPDIAIGRWRTLCQRFPAHQPGWLALHGRLLLAGRREAAAALLADLVVRFPDDPTLRRMLTDADSRRDDFAAAWLRDPSAGWWQASPASHPVPRDGATLRLGLAVVVAPQGYAPALDLLRSLVTFGPASHQPDLFLSLPDEPWPAPVAAWLAGEQGLPKERIHAVRREPRQALPTDLLTMDPLGGETLMAAQAGLGRNHARLQAVMAGFAAGCDLMLWLDPASRMFRPADLVEAAAGTAIRREYRYRTASGNGRRQRAAVRSVWPHLAPDHVLFLAHGERDNLWLYERHAFAGFASHMQQHGSPRWQGALSDSLGEDAAAQLALRLLPGASDWQALMSWSLLTAPLPYRLTALDPVSALFGAAPGDGLWTQLAASGFDQRFLRAYAPPCVPPVRDAALLAMLDEALAESTCLMCPDPPL